jgi:outer membrane protein TolC
LLRQSAAEAQRFSALTQKLEAGGEVAYSDLIKAQLPANDCQCDLQEGRLAAETARYTLAVLVFPNHLTTNYELLDDLRFAPPLPALEDVQQLAAPNNPQLKTVLASVQVAQQCRIRDVSGLRPECRPLGDGHRPRGYA